VNRLLATAGAEHVSPLLRWIGELPDAELAALYSGAIAVLQPSWVEGFGLPVVEALHAGTPAVVADRSALPEIVGDAGMTADPSRPDAWAAAMTALVTGPQLRADLSFRAARRAPRYTWDRAAEETLTVYREILGRI
jgi:glycosyltransferase involved in cell wall biosynthesis